MKITLRNKFPRDGAFVEVNVDDIRSIVDGFIKTNNDKYIAVKETKAEIEKLIKEAEND